MRQEGQVNIFIVPADIFVVGRSGCVSALCSRFISQLVLWPSLSVLRVKLGCAQRSEARGIESSLEMMNTVLFLNYRIATLGRWVCWRMLFFLARVLRLQ